MVDVSAKLKAMKKYWAGAKEDAESGDFPSVPDGTYLFWVTTDELHESGSSGRTQFGAKYTVARGEHAGTCVTDFISIDDADALVWCARWLARMEYEVGDDLTDLPAILAEITENVPLIKATVKNKDGFCNLQTFSIKIEDPMSYDELVPLGGASETGTTTSTASESWADAGKAVEEGDDEDGSREKDMLVKAKGFDLEPDDFSWSALGIELDKLEAESEPESENPSIEETWARYGQHVQEEEDGDGEYEKALLAAAKTHNLDPDQFGWVELGEKIDELELPPSNGDGKIEIGSNVWGVSGGKTHTGEVTAIKDGKATIKTDKGSVEINVDRCELSEVPF